MCGSWGADAAPASWAAFSEKYPSTSAPGRNRTCDLGIRRPLLYPTELRRHAALAGRESIEPVAVWIASRHTLDW